MAKNQSQLTPEQQAVAFLIAKRQGQQPVSGGMSPDTQDPIAQMGTGQMDAQSAQAMFGGVEQQPGDKMHPAEAMHKIASGMQLGRNQQGQLTQRVPVDQPLLRLFGMKKNQTIDTPNFYDTAKAAGIEKFLPSGLPQTPEGTPFMGPHTFQSALQAAQSFGDKTRASFFQYVGNDPDSQLPVTFNSADNQFYKGGKAVAAEALSRLLSKVKPQMAAGEQTRVTDLLNAQSQLEDVKKLFDSDAVGPLQARLFQASKKMGINLPDLKGMASITDDKARLRTVLASGINDYIKAITGAQMSEIEARRIMAAMPDANASDEAFMPVLNEVLKITDMKLKNTLDVLETQGTVGVKELRGLAEKNRRSSRETSNEPPVASPAQPQATEKKDPQARYAQLIKSGLSKKQAYALMHSEGY